MSESKLRELSIDFAVRVIKLCEITKALSCESVRALCNVYWC